LGDLVSILEIFGCFPSINPYKHELNGNKTVIFGIFPTNDLLKGVFGSP